MLPSKKVFALLLFLTSALAFSQKVQQVKASVVSAQEIHIYYDLSETKSGELYDISVYTSTDNFSEKLKNVSGNIGKKITPGSNQKIIWNVQKNLPEFTGNITFEVRAIPYVKKKLKPLYVLIPAAVVGLGIGAIILFSKPESGSTSTGSGGKKVKDKDDDD